MQAHAFKGTGSLPGAVDFNIAGYVFGGGIEWKYNRYLSLRLEGLYYGFNKTKSDPALILTETLKDVAVVRVGANWSFASD